MFPMITSVKEVKEIKAIVNEVRNDLDKAGVAYDKNIRLGIMIETPAAAGSVLPVRKIILETYLR